DDILFDFDSDQLKPESEVVIDDVAQRMKTMENYNDILVEGHTDSIGPDAYNLDLSKRRAGTAKNALVKRGIPEKKLKTEGYGESRPRADNGNFQGRARNRRVEFQINR
ncbi:MAG: OmpA family protein, partial [Bdellovibrionota bacterium]